jgi:KaiC/GvpD/RAD55 family RecA-like ATPase
VPEATYIKASSLGEALISALADKTTMAGTPTCIQGLNELLGGGFRQGELIAIHAPGKMGKSSLVHQLIQGLISSGTPVGYASREMRPADEVMPNLLSIEFNENAWKAHLDDVRTSKYLERMRTWPLYFTPGYGPFPLEKLEPWFKALVAEGVGIFFIDHLHYCLEDPEEHKEVVKLAQALKRIANEQSVAIVCIIQPTKIFEGTKLSQGTIRGGAGVGQALDCLLTFERYRDPITQEVLSDTSVLEVVDIRHKLGRRGKVYLQYNTDTTTITEITIQHVRTDTEQNQVLTLRDRL